MYNLKTYANKNQLEESDIKEATKLLSEIQFRGGWKQGNTELLEDFLEILNFFDRKNREAEEEMPPTESACILLMKAQDFMLYLPMVEKQLFKLKGKI